MIYTLQKRIFVLKSTVRSLRKVVMTYISSWQRTDRHALHNKRRRTRTFASGSM